MKGLILTKALKHQSKIINKAKELVNKFESGDQECKSVKPHHHLVIKVDYSHRLLSKDCGNTWLLMSHEAYNNAYMQP